MNDSFEVARFKAVCAGLDIETQVVTDTFGRQDVLITRDGVDKLIQAGLLPEDPSDLPGFQAAVERREKERDQ